MNPIRTVVAPTDLSALARHAVVRACLLAAELGARLSLQHVVNAGALDTLRHLLDADAADIDIAIIGHGAVGTLWYSALSGQPIDRRHDQPGQGHYFTVDLPSGRVEHPWRPIDHFGQS